MRKILFLLLLTVASYGQTTTGKETKFPYGIRNQSVQTITTPAYLNTQGTDGTQGVIPSAYIEKTANKTSTISGYSETLYPNEKATHDALDLKLNISDLPTNLTLYPTTTASDVSGYVVMVKDIHDVRYNSTAVDVSTPTITTTDQLVSQRISDAGVLIGQPGVFNITTFGNIRHLSGSGTATFYFKVFHRDSAGVETLICTSSISNPVTDGGYSEFTASGVWDDGDFVASDRIVIKSYANRIAGGSDPVYQFQFGGTSPVRTLLPVPFSVVDAGYELNSNKQNSLDIDGTGTKYPTVDAVNAGLPVNYSKIVYVNATSPITATIFDIENPPVTNDNLLKNDVANLYIGTDASTWVYNSTTYVTKTVTATSSNFYLAGTTTDAGNTKTGHITRSGPVTLTGSLNMAIAKISTTPNTSAGSYDILTRNSSTTALEKKLVSDFLQITGNQSSITGRKNFASTNSISGGLGILNQRNSGSDQDGLAIYNSGTTGLYIENTSGGSGVNALSIVNSTSGVGLKMDNFSNGNLLTLRNQGGTGDLLSAEVGKVTISSAGKLSTTEAPTVGNNVTNKTYVDAKITQTITNGVTDKSPSEDAVFDAIDGVVNNIPFNIIGDDIKNNNIGRVLIGDGTHTVDDSAVLINRDITTGGTSLGFHAVRDETLYNTNDVTGLRAYASFDAIPKMQGTALFNHLHSFQSRPNYSGSSLISALRGFTHQPTITGPVDLHQAIFIDDFLGAGTVNQNVGLYIKPLLKGVANYAIFSEGIAPSFFGGTLQTNGLVQGATAKFTSYSGTFGSLTTFDSSGNLMNNPNLTLINGVLSMKFSTARIKSTVTALELESLTNLIFLTAGTEKARIATNGNFLLGSSSDNGASDKLQVTGTLATTSTIKAGATVRLKNYTVATLPSGVQGDTAYVTDALAPTYLGALVGGGAVVCPAFFNGTAWVSH